MRALPHLFSKDLHLAVRLMLAYNLNVPLLVIQSISSVESSTMVLYAPAPHLLSKMASGSKLPLDLAAFQPLNRALVVRPVLVDIDLKVSVGISLSKSKYLLCRHLVRSTMQGLLVCL